LSQQIIRIADLTGIWRSLEGIDQGIGQVRREVDEVRGYVLDNTGEIARLRSQLEAFEELYSRQTQIGHAETRLVKVRQELESKYGHYGEVRRAATGILQAADVSVIRNETVNSVTEELMLLAPGYWLAPALVALAAWLRDDGALAGKALKEALRRDDEKVSLFFALICRRARRAACITWLDRYLGQQNPRHLKRQAIVLIDGIAGGVFPPDAQQACSKRFGAWIAELAEEADFVEQQREQWREALNSQVPAEEYSTRYPHLAKHCSSWALLENLTNRIALGEHLHSHLHQIFDGELPSSASLAEAVDGLLTSLVTDHDVEELPLRREEARLHAVIGADGRLDIANQRYAAEAAAIDEESSFTQLLTNAAMHAELTGASRASQRLAVAFSRDWLRDAFADLVAHTHNDVPASVELVVSGWNGETEDGSNEEHLLASLDDHLSREEEKAVDAVKLEGKHFIALGVGSLIALLAIFNLNWFFMVIGLGLCGWVGYEYSQLQPRMQAIRDDYAQRREAAAAVLRVSIAEFVEWRRDFDRRDALSKEAEAYIASMRPDAHLLAPHDRTRNIVITEA
jgi:hypothetical protein